jgi:hypothetical protein
VRFCVRSEPVGRMVGRTRSSLEVPSGAAEREGDPFASRPAHRVRAQRGQARAPRTRASCPPGVTAGRTRRAQSCGDTYGQRGLPAYSPGTVPVRAQEGCWAAWRDGVGRAWPWESYLLAAGVPCVQGGGGAGVAGLPDRIDPQRPFCTYSRGRGSPRKSAPAAVSGPLGQSWVRPVRGAAERA